MNYFNYVENELHCEAVPVKEIAEKIGTPFYLYSHKTLVRHFRVFDSAFEDIPHIVCFSAKANSNLAILNIVAREGGGVDIVSGGELYRALRAGCDPKKIVYSGVGKRADEIDYAISKEILMFNVESSQELHTINDRAGALGKRARISLRINPDVDPMTHPHISTGLKKNKFGIDIESALNEYRKARELENIDIIGVDCHIGSQITRLSPFIDALDRLTKLIGLLRKDGMEISYLDLGGGLGITYDKERPPHPTDYAKAIKEHAKALGCTLIFEPGRVIAGNAGALVTRVLYTKEKDDKVFVIVDAGMNDLLRPSLYGSYHNVKPVSRQVRDRTVSDIVGPICESGDFLVRDRMLERYERGELIAVMSTGAYGFSMSSNYNSRPRVAEVLAKDDTYYVIRHRETYEDIVRGEEIPEVGR
ncbi:MAG: diaminopimelate decarboxylase [Deltaproteobacteria bacterium]|nr:diaminopimelate decarboxylase [Deltaproteobacteria bacterium]